MSIEELAAIGIIVSEPLPSIEDLLVEEEELDFDSE